jgi:hypothetical protein
MIWHPDNIILGPVQSNPTAWAKVRRGKVTGSRFADVMTPPRTPPRKFVQDHAHLVSEAERYKVLKTGPRAGQKVEVDGLGQMVMEAAERNGTYCWGDTARSYMMEIVASAVTGRDKAGGKSAAMDHGNDTEADAFDHYAAVNFADVRKAQMLILRDTRIAATPDGFVEGDPDGPGLLEIKCPESKTHLATWMARELPEEYFEQVQGQLWVSGRQWCDFVSFDNRFPPSMWMVQIRVQRDEEFIERMEARVRAFACEVDDRLTAIFAYLEECDPAEAEILKDALAEAAEVPILAPEA